MIYLIAAVIVFIGFCIYEACENCVGWAVTIAFLGTLTVALVVLVAIFITSVCLQDKIIYENTETKQNILAIKDSETIKGSFGGNIFMAAGYIDGSMMYVVLLQEKAGYRMFKIDAEKAIVIEKDVQPCIITYKPHIKSKLLSKLLFNMKSKSYEINIPKGSTEFQYKVDLD
jgi:uncharacterized FlgJ-related protein